MAENSVLTEILGRLDPVRKYLPNPDDVLYVRCKDYDVMRDMALRSLASAGRDELLAEYEAVLTEMRTHSRADRLIKEWVDRLDFARDEALNTTPSLPSGEEDPIHHRMAAVFGMEIAPIASEQTNAAGQVPVTERIGGDAEVDRATLSTTSDCTASPTPAAPSAPSAAEEVEAMIARLQEQHFAGTLATECSLLLRDLARRLEEALEQKRALHWSWTQRAEELQRRLKDSEIAGMVALKQRDEATERHRQASENAHMHYQLAGDWKRKCEAAEQRVRELESFLHARRMCPGFEYATTDGPRKAWDVHKPEGEGWESNVEEGRDGWERFEYHEEAYWRRLKPAAPSGDAEGRGK